MLDHTDGVAPELLEPVLEKLGFSHAPEPTHAGLTALYAAWCQRVPFDNIRKLIHLRRDDPGPLPGSEAEDFFRAWLRFGSGGTCWAGNGALHALLRTLGFPALRGYATMMLAPDIPPNHATVVVDCAGRRYLVDASLLHGSPLELSASATTAVTHRAWGVSASQASDSHLIRWRPIHMPQGLDCRIDQIGVAAAVFHEFHERSRPWSPFNYQLYARVNRQASVIGTAFGQQFEFDSQGEVHQRPLEPQARLRYLVETLGIDDALAVQVPADLPTPPPPAAGAR